MIEIPHPTLHNVAAFENATIILPAQSTNFTWLAHFTLKSAPSNIGDIKP